MMRNPLNLVQTHLPLYKSPLLVNQLANPVAHLLVVVAGSDETNIPEIEI